MKFEDQWFLEGFRRQYKMKKIHLKFLGVSRRKNDKKKIGQRHKNFIGGAASCAPAHMPCTHVRGTTSIIVPCAHVPLSCAPKHPYG